jgi:hypothetical protein
MDAWVWIVIAAAAVIVVAAVISTWMVRRRRTGALRSRFGDEYDRRVREDGSRRRVEHRLVDVTDKHDQLAIRPLNAATRARYLTRWQELQNRFLDQPGHALDAADVLVNEVLRERGYRAVDFDEQVDLVGLDHPDVVRHYRAAHDTHGRTRAGLAGTEEIRIAMIQYRSLFEALLAATDPAPAPASTPASAPSPAPSAQRV